MVIEGSGGLWSLIVGGVDMKDKSETGDDVVTQESVAVPVVAGDWPSMGEPVPSWDSIDSISEASGGESRSVLSEASLPGQLMLTQDSSDFWIYIAQYRSVG